MYKEECKMFISKANNYNSKLLEGRIEAEGAVIASLITDMMLLDDYKITSDMFLTIDGVFLFKLLESLKSKNISEITEFDVMNMNEKVYEKFNRKYTIS